MLIVVWVLLLDFVEEEVVDEVDDLEVPREDLGHDVDGPALQEFVAL